MPKKHREVIKRVRKMKKFIILMLPSRLGEVRAYSVLFSEPIVKDGKRWFRFTFVLENKTKYLDIGGSKEEVEVVQKRVGDFNNDRTCETLVVESDQEGKKLHFWKFETNEKAKKFLDSRKVKYHYIM